MWPFNRRKTVVKSTNELLCRCEEVAQQQQEISIAVLLDEYLQNRDNCVVYCVDCGWIGPYSMALKREDETFCPHCGTLNSLDEA